jgi:hypothetical protein
MHAQNQQDLIYKRSQAGITKASVTIVFDDSERDKSPVGFENCKQITVTRQVRFLLLPCVDYHDRIADCTAKCFEIPPEWTQVPLQLHPARLSSPPFTLTPT